MVRLPTIKLPYELTQNATLYFERQIPGAIADSATGNERPAVETVEVRASLPHRRVKEQFSDDETTAVKGLQVTGYIIDPPSMLAELLEMNNKVKIKLTYPPTDIVSYGEFTFNVVPTPYSASLIEQAGIPIRGLLTVSGSGESF